jgi:hypothetical protein
MNDAATVSAQPRPAAGWPAGRQPIHLPPETRPILCVVVHTNAATRRLVTTPLVDDVPPFVFSLHLSSVMPEGTRYVRGEAELKRFSFRRIRGAALLPPQVEPDLEPVACSAYPTMPSGLRGAFSVSNAFALSSCEAVALDSWQPLFCTRGQN